MTEGLLGGVLGGEEDNPEIEAPQALAGAEAFAAAVAARLSGNDPGVALKTEAFLDKQAQLLEVQRKHLEEEHAARLHYLRGQAREVDIRRFGLRLRLGFQLVMALIAIFIGVGIVVMLHDAFTSRSVIVEPFDAPPALAARGLTGKVVASGLLDELSRLQSATRSSRSLLKRDLTNAWANQVTLSIPETGLSLGEISRVLKGRFGHDVQIDGDLIETPAGAFILTVRGSGVAPKSFTGPVTALNALTTAAAEYIYAQSEPLQWSFFLVNTGRYEEAIDFCQQAFDRIGPSDRPYLVENWAVALGSSGGSPRDVLALDRAAIKLKPDFWSGYANVIVDLRVLGDEESAWRMDQLLRKEAGGRPGRATEAPFSQEDWLAWNLPALLEIRRANADLNGGGGTFLSNAGPIIAEIEILLHDPESAELRIQTTRIDPKDVLGAETVHFVRSLMATEAGDVVRAETEMQAVATAYTDPAVSIDRPGDPCWIAPAEEAAGHPDKADAVLKTAGTYVDCYRFHGDILDSRGDWQGAQEWYAKSVELAPDLPAGYFSWGIALAKHGDLAGAEAKLNIANQRGPHWADPLKAWGDVLVKQGKIKDALSKYEEALKYAPHWKQLQEAREALAK